MVWCCDRPVKLYTYDITLDHIPEPRLLTDFGETEEADEVRPESYANFMPCD